jgi:hypothetical protein
VEEQLKGIFSHAEEVYMAMNVNLVFFVAIYHLEKIEPFLTIGEYFKERSTGLKKTSSLDW